MLLDDSRTCVSENRSPSFLSIRVETKFFTEMSLRQNEIGCSVSGRSEVSTALAAGAPLVVDIIRKGPSSMNITRVGKAVFMLMIVARTSVQRSLLRGTGESQSSSAVQVRQFSVSVSKQ